MISKTEHAILSYQRRSAASWCAKNGRFLPFILWIREGQPAEEVPRKPAAFFVFSLQVGQGESSSPPRAPLKEFCQNYFINTHRVNTQPRVSTRNSGALDVKLLELGKILVRAIDRKTRRDTPPQQMLHSSIYHGPRHQNIVSKRMKTMHTFSTNLCIQYLRNRLSSWHMTKGWRS